MDAWMDDTEEAGDGELTDFSFGGKDALLFLIDASPGMHQPLEDEESCLSVALKCVVSCLRSKVFNAPNDLVGVLLYGTEKQVGGR